MLKNTFILLFILILVLLFTIVIFANEGYNKDLPFFLTADGNIGFDVKEKYLYAENNARFEYQGLVIEAEKVAVYAGEERLLAEGDEVILYFDEHKIEGSFLDFNYSKKEGHLADASTDLDEIFFRGERISLHGDRDYNYSIDRASITACKLPDPHYSFQAAQVKVYPGEKIVANNIWLRFGGYKVLFLPVYSARYNQDAGEYDNITPIPEISYNLLDGINVNIAYPYQITDKFTGELETEINQKGDKFVNLANRYRLTPELNIISNYLYSMDYNDKSVSNTSEISTGFQYQNNSLRIAANYVFDLNTKKSMIDLNANYTYNKLKFNYFNRFIDNETNKENYSISYSGKYPIELIYIDGYSLDYLPYLKVKDIESDLWGFDINTTAGIGRVASNSRTADKADIDLTLSRSLLKEDQYNLDFTFKTASNIYFTDGQNRNSRRYNHYVAELSGNYRQQIRDNLSLQYNLGYDYSWDEGDAYLSNDRKNTGQNIRPGLKLRYEQPEEHSAWVLRMNGNYKANKQEFNKMSLRLKRELDCLSYYFDLDIIDNSFSVGMNF
ncbi:MAG: hypothetical protein ACOCRO_03660 [Halanaerobiales bacterium]